MVNIVNAGIVCIQPKLQKQAHVTNCLANAEGPVIAATDYTRAFAEQIRPYIKAPYTVLGTDGFGRSDTREKSTQFF